LSARYAIKCHFFDRLDTKERERRLTRHKATIKRVLFTRSLRLLPLPEQVAVIEALTIVVDFVPGVIPISDQNLLAFLSEFLKLSSIADGEMSDPNIVGFVVDKNGFAGKIQNARNGRPSRHINAIYRRRECVARIGDKAFVLIPEELPLGVQLRVSAIRLFNTVIRRHSDGFFDADPSTPIGKFFYHIVPSRYLILMSAGLLASIGNIRPHVINLLFRSLVSEPPMSVCAAHEALQDVLSLSVVSKDDRNHSRLPKELLQTCIRPVLLNLRDYTRLSVPLLRGLARLLSLLSSWFNKTLGEKLMEHLQKWTEPEMIMACNIWKPGDEPIVAAGIVDLFSLLPHASHFVEPLVKTVIKLEACLHRFRGHRETSPYRKPLARYLNKQCQHAVSFFFQRLKNPMYSELFQDLVALRESETLRAYLSGRQCSVNILNICFERPLAIIRSEKSSSSGKQSPGKAGSPAEIMAVHGIAIQVGKQREALLREEIESKQKKLVLLQQEATRAKEALQARLASSSNPSEQKDSLEDAKRRHRNAQAALDKAQKDLNDCKQRYASEIAHPDTSETSAASIKMTHEALELQHQGLQLVETLMRYNVKYLPEHNDVVRAFRWLWRSKGRHLRLQHEERMPLRFHKESMLLGSLLVEYSRVFPNDVDILFELLRVFLQPTSCDFRYIRRFLENVVSNVLTLEKQKQALQRFFVLLGGEGPEETKVLSIQLIVLPMLLNSRHSSEQGDNRADFIAMSADGAETVSVEEEKSNQTHPAGLGKLVDQEFVDQFVDGVLFKNGNPVLYGDRLRVELFRISTLLIQDEPDLMEKHKTRVIKFSWGLLKSEDTSCKNWAYLNVCAYISAFDTPPKVVVQVYAALIRLHQHEGKGYVRTALSILLSSLQRRLEKEHMHKIVESTSRIIYEEGNNIPQLAHIWQTIVTHPDIYSESCCLFMKHMVNSLTRLGLPPNCPIENRALSLSIAELVLLWNERAVAAAEKDAGATLSQENRPSKRQKEGLVQIKPEDLLDLSMVRGCFLTLLF
jgi:transformation/transcription domain-associated protein